MPKTIAHMPFVHPISWGLFSPAILEELTDTRHHLQRYLSLCEALITLFPLRHFGLGLLEETIRLRWNEMSPEQKFFIKESVMAAMAANSGMAEVCCCQLPGRVLQL